ncbi:hypothetical protein EJB05_56823 [Eragrostis curvula]|uniref:Uncharacterized protein n=2 Tax=Eragrostis curvula TaxID=38414 RepID=A0A5J9SF58_9POAL|nr:hypothetical protein EJB05_56823 [Eragrostis curvula]
MPVIDLRCTSSVNRQAGGIDGRGCGRAQVPQSQGDETLAGKDAMGITPWSCPGNATGMGAPIPGIGAPPPPKPAVMRQVIRRDVDQFMPQPAVRQQLAANGMQQRLGTTPRPGPPGVPPPLPQAQCLNSAANQCGEASRGINFTHRHDASPSNLHGYACSAECHCAYRAGGSDGAGRGRAPVQQSQGDETLAGKDAMGITGPFSCPGNAAGMGACPDCPSFPNLACRICANVTAELGIGPLEQNPQRELELRQHVNLNIVNLPQPHDDAPMVTVPGWDVTQQYIDGLMLFLFGPLVESTISSYCARAEGSTGVAPPREARTAYVLLPGGYQQYIQGHLHGLAAQAHGILSGSQLETTITVDQSNRGIIRESISRFTQPGRPMEPMCNRCTGPADFVVACCNLQLCAYCLQIMYPTKHGCSTAIGSLCQGKGAIGVIDIAREILTIDKNGRFCCNAMVVIVEETMVRPCMRDVFVFRRMDVLSDIMSRDRGRSAESTEIYHMSHNGSLNLVHIFPRRLPFLP